MTAPWESICTKVMPNQKLKERTFSLTNSYASHRQKGDRENKSTSQKSASITNISITAKEGQLCLIAIPFLVETRYFYNSWSHILEYLQAPHASIYPLNLKVPLCQMHLITRNFTSERSIPSVFPPQPRTQLKYLPNSSNICKL